MTTGLAALLTSLQQSVERGNHQNCREQLRECRRLLALWVAWDQEHARLTEQIGQPGQDLQELEEIFDQWDAARQMLVNRSKELLDHPAHED